MQLGGPDAGDLFPQSGLGAFRGREFASKIQGLHERNSMMDSIDSMN